jgi:hypothetical protein
MVRQRSGSGCCSYIVCHYCLRFDRGMVHAVDVIMSTSTVFGLINKGNNKITQTPNNLTKGKSKPISI